MWNYPKSAKHQLAIDALQPERDREAARTRVAVAKLRREQEAVQAKIDRETDRLATLAKTQRLRAARLALEATSVPKKKSPSNIAKRSPRSS